MADRPKEGYSDGSDDGGNKTLRGFVLLIRKSHVGEKNRSMTAEHLAGSTIYSCNPQLYIQRAKLGTQAKYCFYSAVPAQHDMSK